MVSCGSFLYNEIERNVVSEGSEGTEARLISLN